MHVSRIEIVLLLTMASVKILLLVAAFAAVVFSPQAEAARPENSDFAGFLSNYGGTVIKNAGKLASDTSSFITQGSTRETGTKNSPYSIDSLNIYGGTVLKNIGNTVSETGVMLSGINRFISVGNTAETGSQNNPYSVDSLTQSGGTVLKNVGDALSNAGNRLSDAGGLLPSAGKTLSDRLEQARSTRK